MSTETEMFIEETTTVSGLGAITLGGAIANHKAFSAAAADGALMSYIVISEDESQYLAAEGVYTASTNSFDRATIFYSSEAGNANPSFAAGTHRVFHAPIPGVSESDLDMRGNTVSNARGQVVGVETVAASAAGVVDYNLSLGNQFYTETPNNITSTTVTGTPADGQKMTTIVKVPTSAGGTISLLLSAGLAAEVVGGDNAGYHGFGAIGPGQISIIEWVRSQGSWLLKGTVIS